MESLRPRPEWLEGLDAVVFDIQDVGARYYTYVYTMALAMEACAKADVRFVVLDRPNPLGGERVEGNLVEPGFRSFVGLYPLPNRHGMTLGELARMLNAEERFGCDLAVVPCLGWTRKMRWADTGLPFIPPSPNMPTPDTAPVYPGMCLLEGTNSPRAAAPAVPSSSSARRTWMHRRSPRRWSGTSSRGSVSGRCTSCPPGTSTAGRPAQAPSCT